jgi:hypothetical protein
MKYIKTYETNYERYNKWPIINALDLLLKKIFCTSLTYKGIVIYPPYPILVLDPAKCYFIDVSSKGEYIEIFISDSSRFFDGIISIFTDKLETVAKINLDPYYAKFKIKKENVDKAIKIFQEISISEEIQLYAAMNKYNL